MVKTYAYRAPENMSRRDFFDIIPFLSEEKQKRLKSLRRESDAVLTLSGERMVRNIIRALFGLEYGDVKIKTDEKGKPYAEGLEGFYFNVSHSGRYVAAGVGDCPLGVDVERIRKIDLGISRNYFSSQEHDYIMSLPEEERQAGFFQMWTLKESFVKCIGKGLTISLSSFTLQFDGDTIDFKSDRWARHYFKTYDLDDEYKMAACSAGSHFCDNVCVVGDLAVENFIR